MSRRKKAAALAREIAARARRGHQLDTAHLDALRALPEDQIEAEAQLARRSTPILADTIRATRFVPQPPWQQGTTLLPVIAPAVVDGELAEVRDDAELAGAVA